jgi:16S rRNA processing protein RimM
MTEISPNELLLIGVIAGPFGIKGQVKLKSFTDRPDHLSRHVRDLFVGKARTLYTLTRVHEHKPGVLLLNLRGVESREAVDELRGAEVYIRESEAAPLAADEYYLHQLLGLQVLTVEGAEVGKVKEVIETGAGEVLVIGREAQADALVPIVRDFIAELDISGGRVVIRPIEGLL